MELFQGLLLGALQGLTEFLPVSSTGHLIVVRELLGLTENLGLALDAMLHLATALAVIIYFRSDLVAIARGTLQKDPTARMMLLALILGTIPAAVLGFFLEEWMDTAFRSSLLVAGALILGSLIFLIAERLGRQDRVLTVRKGFLVGLFQALALIPGMSRSGMTIAGGLLMGLSRVEAARFGFLLSFPIILGAGLKKLFELLSTGALETSASLIAAGGITAFLFGLAAIHFMIRFVKTHSLMPFVWYRLALASVVIIVTIL